MEKIIYLEPDDEITTVIDKIRKATRDKVILVVPKAATILQSVVNLKLLKNEARKLGKEISIVTSDDTGRNLASQVGLNVYRDIAKRPEPEIKKQIPAQTPKEERPKPQNLEQKQPAATPSDQVGQNPSEKTEGPSFVVNDDQEKAKPKITPKDLDIRHAGTAFRPFKDAKKAGISKTVDKGFLKAKPKVNKKFKKLAIIIGAVLALVVIAAAVASYLFLPKADVEVKLLATKVKSEITLLAKKEESNNDNSLVTREATSAQSGATKTKATGQKTIGEKASGTITVINETGADQPLVATTRFQASNGLIYRTNSAVTVPKATLNKAGDKVNGSVNVAVVADQPGSEYNLDAASFTIPGLSASLQQRIYGRSSTAMSGGESRVVTIVSQEDIDTAKAKLTKELKSKALESLDNEISGEDLVLDGAVISQVEEESAEPALNAEANEFSLNLKTNFTFLVIKKNQYLELVKNSLQKKIPQDKEVVEEELENSITATVSDLNKEQGSMKINVMANAPVVAKMSEEVMKDNLKGKSADEAVAYLKEFEEINDAQVSLWPFFTKKVPSNSSRINMATSYYLESEDKDETKETEE